jgi:hypothetical protein
MKLFHPSERALVAFASGESGARASIARHLERCSECRQLVGFTQRLSAASAALPPVVLADDLLARALADRAAGMRVILPAPMEPVRIFDYGRAMRLGAMALAAAAITLWWYDRARVPEVRSVNEILLAGFMPRTAEAWQGGSVGPLTHKLRNLSVAYQRRFIDSASGRVTKGGVLELEVSRGPGEVTWSVASAWHELTGVEGMQSVRVWAESLAVADSSLLPARRVVHVMPYRRWAGIRIDQRFRNDSVVGQMSLDEDPTRRPIAHDLASVKNRLLASDALATLWFMGVPMVMGAEFDVQMLGWAVIPKDVIMPLRMRVVASERVETPAGAFDCWKLAVAMGRETHFHWVRKSDHLGVLTRRRMPNGATREIILLREASDK